MKIYKIKVNGKTYKVELESVEENNSSLFIKEENNSKKTEEVKLPSGEGKEVVSPIQGTVVKVNVKVGDKVKKGDSVVVVEAMKLENDVVSSYDGTVSEILVNKGATVSAKQALIVVK